MVFSVHTEKYSVLSRLSRERSFDTSFTTVYHGTINRRTLSPAAVNDSITRQNAALGDLPRLSSDTLCLQPRRVLPKIRPQGMATPRSSSDSRSVSAERCSSDAARDAQNDCAADVLCHAEVRERGEG